MKFCPCRTPILSCKLISPWLKEGPEMNQLEKYCHWSVIFKGKRWATEQWEPRFLSLKKEKQSMSSILMIVLVVHLVIPLELRMLFIFQENWVKSIFQKEQFLFLTKDKHDSPRQLMCNSCHIRNKAWHKKCEIAKWLDNLTLVQRESGSKPPSDLSQNVRRDFASSLQLQAKRITRCGHIDWKDSGSTLQLVYLFSGPYLLNT